MPVTKLTPVKKLNSNNTSLVHYGKIGNTTLIGLNKNIRDNTLFPVHVISQLVGHLLGDGSLYFNKTSVTPYIVFTQTLKRFGYIWFVFQQLSHYCGRYPLLNVSVRKGNHSYYINVVIRSYPKMHIFL